MFWIASMTKPITGTAVLMMQEEGLLSVNDPVAKYLPEYANLKDAAGSPVIITIAQCLTHTSGLSELLPEELKECNKLADLVPRIVAKPVKFPPGSKWEYCQTSINTVARVVEVLSGKAYPEFLQDRLFTPLGMKDTTFYPTEAQIARLATSYQLESSNELKPAVLKFLNGSQPASKDRAPLASGGLFSTAVDYAKFAQMILRGGEVGGKRFLSEDSVKQMTTIQSGDLTTGFTPGNAWGLGWGIVREPQGVSAALSRGSFGHGGAYGTQVWIDPEKDRVYLLMIQRADIGNSDASDMRRDFQNAATAKP